MAEFPVYKLTFRSSLLLSLGRKDYSKGAERLHSDTLKSALFVAARNFFTEEDLGEGDEFFRRFELSSAFPFIDDEYFFPKPVALTDLDFPELGNQKAKKRKLEKKVKYLGKSLFEQAIMGNKVKIYREMQYGNFKFISPSMPQLLAKTGEDQILKTQTEQRVTVPHYWENEEGEKKDAEPFFLSQTWPGKDAGFFFLVNPREGDEQIMEILDAAMRLLQDSGLGTARSRGMGHFTFVKEELTLNTPESGTHQMNLSLYSPDSDNFPLDAKLLEKSAWDLIQRGGWVASTSSNEPGAIQKRKKTLQFFKEGSVFSGNMSLPGQIAELQTKEFEKAYKHNIYRDGRPLWLPFQQAKTD